MNLKKKIFLINFFTSIIPLLIIAIISSSLFSKKINELEEKRIELINHTIEEKMDEQIDISIEILDHLIEIYEEFENDYPENEMIEHMKHLSETKNDLKYIIFGSSDKELYINEKHIKSLNIPTNYDPTISHWYQGALNSNDYYLSEEFNYIGIDTPVVTLSKKIEKNGKIVGVLSGVLDLSTLSSHLLEYKIGKNGSFYILDKKNKILVDTGDNNKNNKYLQYEILKDMKHGKIDTKTPDGLRCYYIHHIEKLDLFLIGTVLEKDLNSATYELRAIIIILVIIITLLIIFSLSFIIKKFDNALNKLSYVIKSISSGNYSKNIDKLTEVIDEKSELKFIKDAIENMNFEIIKRESELKFIAETDQLTNIYNRRAILDFIHIEIERSKKFNTEYVLLMFDLDKFKRLNDKFGHLFGDEVLRQVCKTISEDIKEIDKLGRYGGEEFLLLLPNIQLSEGILIAERLRKKIARLKWEKDVVVTISIGAIKNMKNDTLDISLERVDNLLYKAKNSGRNKVESQNIDILY